MKFFNFLSLIFDSVPVSVIPLPFPDSGFLVLVLPNLESGIRNAELVTLLNVTCWSSIVQFDSFFSLAEAQFALQ